MPPKPKSHNPTGDIVTKWKTESSVQGSWLLNINERGQAQFILSGDGTTEEYVATSDVVLSINAFYHLAGVYTRDDNIVRIFVNGRETGTATGPEDGIFISDARVVIGAELFSERYFDGIIDEVRIYNRALTKRQIRLLAVYPFLYALNPR